MALFNGDFSVSSSYSLDISEKW